VGHSAVVTLPNGVAAIPANEATMRRVIPIVLVLAACHGGSKNSPAPAPATSASFTLQTADGREVGRGSLQQTPAGVLITADLNGMPAGTHGIHLHTVGQCSAPDVASAGGHFHPSAKMHGIRNPAGHHAGDLTNISLPESGALRVELLAPDVRLGPGAGALLDADGASIVVHALADDYQTDPSGASGSRIACGVIH
jgi:Cu-Zn family superoxide dismutase